MHLGKLRHTSENSSCTKNRGDSAVLALRVAHRLTGADASPGDRGSGSVNPSLLANRRAPGKPRVDSLHRLKRSGRPSVALVVAEARLRLRARHTAAATSGASVAACVTLGRVQAPGPGPRR